MGAFFAFAALPDRRQAPIKETTKTAPDPPEHKTAARPAQGASRSNYKQCNSNRNDNLQVAANPLRANDCYVGTDENRRYSRRITAEVGAQAIAGDLQPLFLQGEFDCGGAHSFRPWRVAWRQGLIILAQFGQAGGKQL